MRTLKIRHLLALALVSLLMGCITSPKLPDDINPALMLGEAAYFAHRCPSLKQQRMQDALVVACMLNKANGINCPRAMETRLVTDLKIGMMRAMAENEGRPDRHVCRLATERYGRSGTRFKNMLVHK